MPKSYFPQVTITEVYNSLKKILKLQWLGGESNQSAVIKSCSHEQICLVGYLNSIHHYPISVIGNKEYEYLANLDSDEYHDLIISIFDKKPYIIIVADGQNAPDVFVDLANKNEVALLYSPYSSQLVIDHLIYYLNSNIAESTTLHGVFLEIFDFGVLICGDSGCGKSELALELIHRSHRLVADDAPTLMRITPTTVIGSSPALLHEYLEVRGLGIINIRRMFGDAAVKDRKQLQLIINIIPANSKKIADIDRLNIQRKVRKILDVDIPEITLPITVGSNLAILVETAVRNQILINKGYNAADRFIKSHKKAIINTRKEIHDMTSV